MIAYHSLLAAEQVGTLLQWSTVCFASRNWPTSDQHIAMSRLLDHGVATLQDYDLSKTIDWDDMKSCCAAAKQQNIIDGQCSSMPPRPPPSPAAPTVTPDHDDLQVDEDYW